jgi:hypothetical protein
MPHSRAAGHVTARHPPTAHDRADSVPLAEFEWNDEIVGIGFFPDEVLLPPDWPRGGGDG